MHIMCDHHSKMILTVGDLVGDVVGDLVGLEVGEVYGANEIGGN